MYYLIQHKESLNIISTLQIKGTKAYRTEMLCKDNRVR